VHFLKLRSRIYLNGKEERSAERWMNSEQKQYRGKYVVLLKTKMIFFFVFRSQRGHVSRVNNYSAGQYFLLLCTSKEYNCNTRELVGSTILYSSKTILI
jgi:hypothetical protein